MVLGRMHQYGPKGIAEKAPNGIEYELKRLYYDVAGLTHPRLRPSQVSSPPRRFCSAATIPSSHSLRQLKA